MPQPATDLKHVHAPNTLGLIAAFTIGSHRFSSTTVSRLPLLLLVIFAGYIAVANWEGLRGSISANSQIEMFAAAGELIHALQLERGLVAQHIASRARNPTDALVAARQLVDHRFIRFATADLTSVEPSRTAQTALRAVRAAVDARQIYEGAAVATYSGIIEGVFRASAPTQAAGDAYPMIISLSVLRQLKEALGRERALGASAFERGSLSEEQRRTWHSLRQTQEFLSRSLNAFAPLQLQSELATALPQDLMAQLAALRSYADDAAAMGSAGGVNGKEWIVVLTAVIDRIGELDSAFTDRIGWESRSSTARAVIVLMTVIVTVILAISLVLRYRWRLGRAEGLLEYALENIDEGFAIWDHRDRLTICNRRFVELCGLKSGELEIQPGTDFAALMRAISRASNTDEADRWVEQRLKTHRESAGRDEVEFGVGKWLRISERRLPDSGVVGVYVDVSDLYALTDELRETGARLQKLHRAVEQSPVSVLITAPDATIEYVNPAFSRTSGYAAEEVIGKTPRVLRSGQMSDAMYGELWSTILSGKDWHGEVVNKTKSGKIFYEDVTISPVFNDDGEIINFIGIKTDITDMKQLRISAEEASRAKSEFIANMSHELRTPLNAIVGFSDLMRSQVFGPLGSEKYLEYLNDVRGAGEHLLALINDILDISRIEAGRMELSPEPTDLVEIAQMALRLVAHRAKQGEVLVSCGESPPVVVMADRRRMKQAVLNVLNNAVKFTPPGGHVTVSIGQDVNDAWVQVIDSGIGMAPEEIPTALQPFRQVSEGLSRRHEGTGLGLPLTKVLVEMHGGQLEIVSEKGIGTLVKILLPVRQLAAV